MRQVSSALEKLLDKIEADPKFQQMMAASDADIKAGRVISHEEVLKVVHGKTRNKKRFEEAD